MAKEKNRAYELMARNENYIQTFEKLGDAFFLSKSRHLFENIEEFVCELYNQDVKKVNDARYKIFCRSSATEENLPPTQSALLQHAKRACYQAGIQKRCLQQIINTPSRLDMVGV